VAYFGKYDIGIPVANDSISITSARTSMVQFSVLFPILTS
jgi:hypothetical protein